MITLGRSLSKLKIDSYADRESARPIGQIEALYNPESVSLSYKTEYENTCFINSNAKSHRYQSIEPGTLSLQLLFDTYLPGNSKTVDEQLSDLRELCYAVDGKTGEPRFLKIIWGQMKWHGKGYFAGRTSSMKVDYTLFERDGTPLRATVTLTIVADESLVIQGSELGIMLPEVPVISVSDMSSLALMAFAAAMVGIVATSVAAADSYLDLAFENDLDNLDDFEAGDSLVATSESTAS